LLPAVNQFHLLAQVQDISALRYTPAGLPVQDFVLQHESTVEEAGRPRKVSMEISSVMVGEPARRLQSLGVGRQARFSGFLAAQRNGRGIVFHVTEVQVLNSANHAA